MSPCESVVGLLTSGVMGTVLPQDHCTGGPSAWHGFPRCAHSSSLPSAFPDVPFSGRPPSRHLVSPIPHPFYLCFLPHTSHLLKHIIKRLQCIFLTQLLYQIISSL